MTPKEIVKAVFPKAFVEPCGEIYQIVIPHAYGTVSIIGSARTKRYAWFNAANTIKRRSLLKRDLT